MWKRKQEESILSGKQKEEGVTDLAGWAEPPHMETALSLLIGSFCIQSPKCFLPKGIGHPTNTGFLRHHPNPHTEQITSSYTLATPGERLSVREKMGSRTTGLTSTLGKPAPPLGAETQSLAQQAICPVGGAGRGVLVGHQEQ